MNEVRIDKWMWATRIFKTRTIAAEACKKGRIMIGGVTIKPSRMIKVGDVIQVRKPPITFSFKVIGLIENRVGAKLVPNYLENVTTPGLYLFVHHKQLVSIGFDLRKHSGGLLFGSREAISSVQSVIDTIHWGFISAYSEK